MTNFINNIINNPAIDWTVGMEAMQFYAIETGVTVWVCAAMYGVYAWYKKAQKRHWARRRADRAKAARQNKMV